MTARASSLLTILSLSWVAGCGSYVIHAGQLSPAYPAHEPACNVEYLEVASNDVIKEYENVGYVLLMDPSMTDKAKEALAEHACRAGGHAVAVAKKPKPDETERQAALFDILRKRKTQ